MNIIICDDDRNTRNLVSSYIVDSKIFSNYRLIEFSSSEELLSSVRNGLEFDIVFLDVEMGEINGIKCGHLLKSLSNHCLIIYISNYSKYAIESFDNEPLHYILKPIDKNKFLTILNKAKCKISHYNQKINIRYRDRIVSIPTKDILYIEYYRKHLIYHCKDSEYDTIGKVKDIVEQLENFGFILINQAILVNAKHIKQISKLDIIMDNNETLMISVRKKSNVINNYTKYLKETAI